MALIKCPECGTEIEDEILSCPECGYPISKEAPTDPKQAKTSRRLLRKIIALAMCLVSIFCLYTGFTTITGEKYRFYQEHYAQCMQGYGENAAMSDSYAYGFFKSSYQDIANSYLDLADDDMEKIWEYRITAIAFGASGVLLLVGAVLIFPKRRHK